MSPRAIDGLDGFTSIDTSSAVVTVFSTDEGETVTLAPVVVLRANSPAPFLQMWRAYLEPVISSFRSWLSSLNFFSCTVRHSVSSYATCLDEGLHKVRGGSQFDIVYS